MEGRSLSERMMLNKQGPLLVPKMEEDPQDVALLLEETPHQDVDQTQDHDPDHMNVREDIGMTEAAEDPDQDQDHHVHAETLSVLIRKSMVEEEKKAEAENVMQEEEAAEIVEVEVEKGQKEKKEMIEQLLEEIEAIEKKESQEEVKDIR